MPADRVKDELEALFFKGIVFPRDFDKREYYRFARNILQLHDAAMASQALDAEKDRHFYELWHDFNINEIYTWVANRYGSLEKPTSRVLPTCKAIDGLPDVLPCEDFREILKAQKIIAIAPCSCRYGTTSAGEHCDYASEEKRWNCFQFGRSAEYVIRRGSGRQISLDEALELIEKIAEDGLVHRWRNTTDMAGTNTACQCCRDCCVVYVSMDLANVPIGIAWAKSRYQAYVDVEKCDGCQVCVDRCHFDAIDMQRPQGSKKYKAVIDGDKCFGCGLCILTCEPGALKLKAVRPPEHIPQAA
jgi:NAD-dependent dihydropyrimidine dehydrogenase PreA subunit